MTKRILKFRAWDKEKNKFIFLDSLFDIGDILEPFESRYIFMQFTGLTDKNGKEICEGDIVKCDFVSGNGLKEVKFEGGSFYPISRNNEGVKKNLMVEVIGNIYENPELLK